MPTPQTQTLRECIEAGGRGDFAKALLALYDAFCQDRLRAALVLADDANAIALRLARDAWMTAIVRGLNVTARNCLCKEFPGLAHLDEPCDNAHAIKLRAEEAS